MGEQHVWSARDGGREFDQGDPKCEGIVGNIILVSAGGMFSCAVTEDGSLYTWGCNSEGQLGHGDRKDRSKPTKVVILESEPVFDVACGDEFMCVLAGDNGNIYMGEQCMRPARSWRLDSRLVPTVQHINSPIHSRGSAHMCALALGESGGEVLQTWGAGAKGQLGHGTFTNVLLPKPVKCDNLVEKAICSMACGAHHTCVVVGEDLYAWGDGSYKQLGTSADGDNSDTGGSAGKGRRKSVRMSVANAMSLATSNNSSRGHWRSRKRKLWAERLAANGTFQRQRWQIDQVVSVSRAAVVPVALVSRTDGVGGWVLDSEVNECMNNAVETVTAHRQNFRLSPESTIAAHAGHLLRPMQLK